MEIEPIPAEDHLIKIYRSLPDITLEAEETRIKATLSDLAGKLIAITQIRETE